MDNGEDDNRATHHLHASDENSYDAQNRLIVMVLSPMVLMGIVHEPPVISLAHARRSNLHETWPIDLKYKTKRKRLHSFKNWPKQFISKEQLAHAGFYYTGNADIVQCFRCGGVLRNWEPMDDPWEEHARFFPHCGHIKDLTRRSNIAQSNEPEVIPGHRDSGDPIQGVTDINDLNTQLKCRSCGTNQPNTWFIPCYHAVYCWECACTYARCPSCNTSISNKFKFSFFEPSKPSQ